jgi:hypothetical protein
VAATNLAALAAVTPNDPAWPAQEEMRRIEAQRAWEVTTGRPEVVVAVLDTGASATGRQQSGWPGRAVLDLPHPAAEDPR